MPLFESKASLVGGGVSAASLVCFKTMRVLNMPCASAPAWRPALGHSVVLWHAPFDYSRGTLICIHQVCSSRRTSGQNHPFIFKIYLENRYKPRLPLLIHTPLVTFFLQSQARCFY